MAGYLGVPGFDKGAIRHLPGCAIWTDEFGTILLGFSSKDEGAALEVNQNLEPQFADETGETPLYYFTKGETARISFPMLQTNLDRLARVVPTAELVGGVIRFGNRPGKQMPTGKIVHRPFSYPDGSRDLVLNNAINIADQNYVHKGADPMIVSCTFEGVVDEDQDDGQLLNGGIGQA